APSDNAYSHPDYIAILMVYSEMMDVNLLDTISTQDLAAINDYLKGLEDLSKPQLIDQLRRDAQRAKDNILLGKPSGTNNWNKILIWAISLAGAGALVLSLFVFPGKRKRKQAIRQIFDTVIGQEGAFDSLSRQFQKRLVRGNTDRDTLREAGLRGEQMDEYRQALAAAGLIKNHHRGPPNGSSGERVAKVGSILLMASVLIGWPAPWIMTLGIVFGIFATVSLVTIFADKMESIFVGSRSSTANSVLDLRPAPVLQKDTARTLAVAENRYQFLGTIGHEYGHMILSGLVGLKVRPDPLHEMPQSRVTGTFLFGKTIGKFRESIFLLGGIVPVIPAVTGLLIWFVAAPLLFPAQAALWSVWGIFIIGPFLYDAYWNFKLRHDPFSDYVSLGQLWKGQLIYQPHVAFSMEFQEFPDSETKSFGRFLMLVIAGVFAFAIFLSRTMENKNQGSPSVGADASHPPYEVFHPTFPQEDEFKQMILSSYSPKETDLELPPQMNDVLSYLRADLCQGDCTTLMKLKDDPDLPTDQGQVPARVIILGGHGNPKSLALGTDVSWKDGWSTHGAMFLDVNDGLKLGEASIQNTLERDGTIILISCSTGCPGQVLGNLADILQDVYVDKAKHIFAPSTNTSFKEFVWRDGRIIGVNYNHGETYDAVGMVYLPSASPASPVQSALDELPSQWPRQTSLPLEVVLFFAMGMTVSQRKRREGDDDEAEAIRRSFAASPESPFEDFVSVDARIVEVIRPAKGELGRSVQVKETIHGPALAAVRSLVYMRKALGAIGELSRIGSDRVLEVIRRYFRRVKTLSVRISAGEEKILDRLLFYINEKLGIGKGGEPGVHELEASAAVLEVISAFGESHLEGMNSPILWSQKGGIRKLPVGMLWEKFIVSPAIAQKLDADFKNVVGVRNRLLRIKELTGMDIGQMRVALRYHDDIKDIILDLIELGVNFGTKGQALQAVLSAEPQSLETKKEIDKIFEDLKERTYVHWGNVTILSHGEISVQGLYFFDDLDIIISRTNSTNISINAGWTKATGAKLFARLIPKGFGQGNYVRPRIREALKQFDIIPQHRPRVSGTRNKDFSIEGKFMDDTFTEDDLIPGNDFVIIMAAVNDNPFIKTKGLKTKAGLPGIPGARFIDNPSEQEQAELGHVVVHVLEIDGYSGRVVIWRLSYRTELTELLSQYRTISRRFPWDKRRIGLAFSIGTIYGRYGNFKEAESYFDEGIEVAIQRGETYFVKNLRAARDTFLGWNSLINGSKIGNKARRDAVRYFERAFDQFDESFAPQAHIKYGVGKVLSIIHETAGDEEMMAFEKLKERKLKEKEPEDRRELERKISQNAATAYEAALKYNPDNIILITKTVNALLAPAVQDYHRWADGYLSEHDQEPLAELRWQEMRRLYLEHKLYGLARAGAVFTNFFFATVASDIPPDKHLDYMIAFREYQEMMEALDRNDLIKETGEKPVADRIMAYRESINLSKHPFLDLGLLFTPLIHLSPEKVRSRIDEFARSAFIVTSEAEREAAMALKASSRTPVEVLDERIALLEVITRERIHIPETQHLFMALGLAYFRKALILANFGADDSIVRKHYRQAICKFKQIMRHYRGAGPYFAQLRVVQVLITFGALEIDGRVLRKAKKELAKLINLERIERMGTIGGDQPLTPQLALGLAVFMIGGRINQLKKRLHSARKRHLSIRKRMRGLKRHETPSLFLGEDQPRPGSVNAALDNLRNGDLDISQQSIFRTNGYVTTGDQKNQWRHFNGIRGSPATLREELNALTAFLFFDRRTTIVNRLINRFEYLPIERLFRFRNAPKEIQDRIIAILEFSRPSLTARVLNDPQLLDAMNQRVDMLLGRLQPEEDAGDPTEPNIVDNKGLLPVRLLRGRMSLNLGPWPGLEGILYRMAAVFSLVGSVLLPLLFVVYAISQDQSSPLALEHLQGASIAGGLIPFWQDRRSRGRTHDDDFPDDDVPLEDVDALSEEALQFLRGQDDDENYARAEELITRLVLAANGREAHLR
ncbi:MAG: hypothetical protein Q7S13_05190, partial [Candidatus Omnitrophota bacterium]|nr:hypothetical protein [Candidatus Omnitrophota bacterium]